MNNERFDTWTKSFAQRRSRREILKGFGGVAAAVGLVALHGHVSAAPGGRAAATFQLRQTTASTPEEVVQRYYLAISTYDYKTAYDLFDAKMKEAQQSYNHFVNGYADTAYDQVKITSTRPHLGHTDVFVVITAWHNDRSIHRYSGHYAVGEEAGKLRIIGAATQEDAAPTDVLPLCRVQDLRGSLARWQGATGNRITEFDVTNTSGNACLAAGVPHVQFYDKNGMIIESASEQTEPMTPVRLDPGQRAQAGIRWSNWCGNAPQQPFRVNVAIPGDTARFNLQNAELSVPPCLGQGQPSSLGVKAFEAV
ncbi:MAG TPA: DUF4232 domain-containing protein [Thermomicrobiales bacterium]|nr:DUF4232 domain-containing protein [Thermomicrobiales bacterium]